MDGNIFDIKRYAIHDGPGIRTTVFMKGCPLHCRWCHNPESQSPTADTMTQTHKLGDKEFIEQRIVGYTVTPSELWKIVEKDRVFFEESSGGVTFSGGEPFAQPHFLLECLKLCRQHRVHTCIETAGTIADKLLDEICLYTDLFLYDIKTADVGKFAAYVGNGYDQIWENLKRIVAARVDVIVRIPIIPGFNDSPEDIEAILTQMKTIKGLHRIELLPYHRTGSDKYRRLGRIYEMNDIQVPEKGVLEKINQQLVNAGYIVG